MCSIDAGPADEGAQLLIFVAPAAHSVQEDSKGGFMYKFLNVALIICAGMCTAIVCASAQSEGQNANGKPAADVRPLVDYSPIIAKLKKQLPQQMVESNVPGLAIALVDGATDQTHTAETPTVDQILDKYTQALGGEAAFRKLTTRTLTGTMEMRTAKEIISPRSDVTGDYEIYAAAPNKRVEINRIKISGCMERDTLEGFNNRVGWSNWGQFRKLDGAALEEKRLEAEFYREIKLKELYPRMTFSGTEKVSDRLAYVIDATPAEGRLCCWSSKVRSN